MKFTNSSQDENEERDFVHNALKKHFRGDMQVVFDHLPEFIQSPAVRALLGKFHDLEKEVFQVWEMEGYGQSVERGEEAENTPPEDGEEVQVVQQAESEIVVDLEKENPRKITLPNGKVGQPYRFSLTDDFPELLFAGACSLRIGGLRESELILDAQSFVLWGRPDNPGHFSLSFTLLCPGEVSEQFSADLHIIPDPRLLWKDIEPEPDQPFAKSHTRVAMLRAGEKYLLGASRRGRSHAHTGAFREDDFALAHLEDSGWYLAAVADGAGSAGYSRRGSQLACDVAIHFLREVDWTEFEQELAGPLAAFRDQADEQSRQQVRTIAYRLLGKAAFQAYKAILAEAEAMESEPSAFHTTLLLTIARRFEFGWWIAAWWAGDGALGVYRKGEDVQLMGAPDGGEFAGQTRFLTSKDVWESGEKVMERIQFALVDDFTALALMTDGVSDPKFQTDHNLRQVEKWDEWWAELQAEADLASGHEKAPARLLEWLNFWSTGDHDDRTIVLLY